ncbi:MAG: MBL fold metallo-hydrolase [Desulfurococcales archaeon]|nr:MBL fold metallo-hydrolase [Desulfurococcales archaeon]
MLADVKSNGAVLLGMDVVADSYWPRIIRVVTHAHSDHLMGINRSIKESLFVVATEVTHRFLDVLGYRVPSEKRLSLDYNKSFSVESEVITLVPSRHIAGSAQVLVESREYRVGYTGDFKLPGTPPLEGLDILVIDATYGSPRLQRRWGEWDALAALINIIEDNIASGPVWLYGYNGKLQEIMVELRRRGVSYPFLADESTLKLARIAAEFYGTDIGEVDLYHGQEVDYSAIIFMHTTRRRYKRRLPGVHVVLTGWEMRAPAVRVDDNVYNVSFSDHASFKEVIEYVEEARPKMLIIDSYRGKDAWFTAKYVERILGIPAIPRPRGAPSGGD